MPKRRPAQPSEQRPGAWFAHIGVCKSLPQSTTRSALERVHKAEAAQCTEDKLPLAYRFRELKTKNNNFPFSSHDNRHSLENVGEYFDLGMGRRKVKPERLQQNPQNYFLWAPESVPSSKDGSTIYQTSFVTHQNTESPFCRRYPKHHAEECCTGDPFLRIKEKWQPSKSF